MIIYYAGAENKQHREVLFNEGIRNMLFCYYNIRKTSFKDIPNNINIFLDSGGFIARNKGVKVSVENYCEFIKSIKYPLKVIANLDTNNVDETLKNHYWLIEQGIDNLPVYHYSDYASLKYRELLLEYTAKYSYVAIGGIVGANLNKKQAENYLNYVFSKTKNTKLHGFGINKKSILESYPFYSVDATSWLSFASYGQSAHKTMRNLIYKKYIAKTVDWKKLVKIEINHYKELELYLTKLWEVRGIKWR